MQYGTSESKEFKGGTVSEDASSGSEVPQTDFIPQSLGSAPSVPKDTSLKSVFPLAEYDPPMRLRNFLLGNSETLSSIELKKLLEDPTFDPNFQLFPDEGSYLILAIKAIKRGKPYHYIVDALLLLKKKKTNPTLCDSEGKTALSLLDPEN